MIRRDFLRLSLGALGGFSLSLRTMPKTLAVPAEAPFDISLAEWSLVKTLRAEKMTNLDFPRVSKTLFGIDRVEFVDQFFTDKARDIPYLTELKTRADGEGVSLGLIMLDQNGPLGTPDSAERAQSIENTKAWIDAGAFLGCDTIRVNARGVEDADELSRWMAESCAQLAEYAAPRNINITIENHGGPSSDPAWLVKLMETVNHPRFGTLPDFGNFPDSVDCYDAVEQFMPFAKAVSAKTMRFSEAGIPADTDFPRMMRIVRDGGYTGYVGVETGAPEQENEARSILWTRDELLRIREEQKKCMPIFNGQDLEGWVPIEGGDWTVEDAVLVGRNGRNWSTDPERTGSWLRTKEVYSDFRLELQYMISDGGNSGVFFRSAEEKNPAFTGYEMQIHDTPNTGLSKQGSAAIYDVVGPTEQRVRPAGQWNTVTISAMGDQIKIEMNGKTVVDTKQTRASQGYIGLQNHDEKAVVRFRNIRVERLSP